MSTLKEQLDQFKVEIPTETKEEAIIRVPVIDKHGRAYATGKRKDATARVWIKRGTGQMIINGRPSQQYFARPVLRMIINQPFQVTDTVGTFDVHATVSGGGLSGQAGALKHALARAMVAFNPDLRPFLRQAGFITRDPREVERKKPGQRGARRSFQFSKR